MLAHSVVAAVSDRRRRSEIDAAIRVRRERRYGQCAGTYVVLYSKRKRLPSGALSRRGNVETPRTARPSRNDSLTGPWPGRGRSRRTPKSGFPSPRGEGGRRRRSGEGSLLSPISPHSAGRNKRQNRRLGDFPMMKRQEESSWIRLVLPVGRAARSSSNALCRFTRTSLPGQGRLPLTWLNRPTSV